MNPMLSTSLPIVTVWVAAILGLLGSVLTLNVILNRVRSGVGTGDGGKPALAQAIRAHCNFTEQAPLALILLAAAEMTLCEPRSLAFSPCCWSRLGWRVPMGCPRRLA